MPLYDWTCDKCEAHINVMRPIKDCQKPPHGGDDDWQESACEHEWRKLLAAPQVLRHSYLDGQRSSSAGRDGQEFAKMKRATELEVKAMGAKFGSEERKEINQEIRALKGQK